MAGIQAAVVDSMRTVAWSGMAAGMGVCKVAGTAVDMVADRAVGMDTVVCRAVGKAGDSLAGDTLVVCMPG